MTTTSWWGSGCKLVLVLLLFATQGQSQAWWQQADSLKPKRVVLATSAQAVTYTSTLTGLYFLWYASYDQSNFHFFDDLQTWHQMDKMGHITTSYQIGDGLYRINRWTGLPHKKAMRRSLLLGYSYQLVVEVFDGFSDAWGFSYSDQIANTLGTTTFWIQQEIWDEQRIKWKYSFWPSKLGNGNTPEAQRAENLYGTSLTEKWLKDYNGQTYWLSANIWSLAGKPDNFPRWLNVALGYSASGLLGAERNSWDIDDQVYTSSVERGRQLVLSLDIDLYKARLPKFLEFVKPVFGLIKFPFPALEWNTTQGFKGHLLYL